MGRGGDTQARMHVHTHACTHTRTRTHAHARTQAYTRTHTLARTATAAPPFAYTNGEPSLCGGGGDGADDGNEEEEEEDASAWCLRSASVAAARRSPRSVASCAASCAAASGAATAGGPDACRCSTPWPLWSSCTARHGAPPVTGGLGVRRGNWLRRVTGTGHVAGAHLVARCTTIDLWCMASSHAKSAARNVFKPCLQQSLDECDETRR